MSSLLIKEPPLQVLPTLATKIGLNEAIFLQQLHYWLKISGKPRDGKLWVYNTYEGWQKQFPFWSLPTVRRIVKSLRDQSVMDTTDRYNTSNINRTLWYTICYDKVDELDNPDADSGDGGDNTPPDQDDHSTAEIDSRGDHFDHPPPDQVDQVEGSDCASGEINMITSIYGTETTTETNAETITETNIGDHRPAADGPPSTKAELSYQLCRICHGHRNPDSLTDTQRGAIRAETKRIHEMGYGPKDLERWFEQYWTGEWRWQKGKERPGPATVRSRIEEMHQDQTEVMAAYAAGGGYTNVHANGHYEEPPPDPGDPPEPETDAGRLWRTIYAELRQQLAPETIGFLDAVTLEEAEDGYALVITDPRSRDYIEHRLRHTVARALSTLRRQKTRLEIRECLQE